MSSMPLTRPAQPPIANNAPAALTLSVFTVEGKEFRFAQREVGAARRLLESLDLTKTFGNPYLQIGSGREVTLFPTAMVARIELAAAVSLETQWPAGMMLVREIAAQEAAQAAERMRLEREMNVAPTRPGVALAELDITGGQRFFVEIRQEGGAEAVALGPRTALDQPLYHNRIFGASGTPFVSATGTLIVLNPMHIVRAVVYAPTDIPAATLMEMTPVS